jgi:hypothetical protein
MYDTATDRESAYELLKSKAERAAAAEQAAKDAENQAAKAAEFQKEQEKLQKQREKEEAARKKNETSGSELIGDIAESTARSFGSNLGRSLVRGILGSLTGKSR